MLRLQRVLVLDCQDTNEALGFKSCLSTKEHKEGNIKVISAYPWCGCSTMVIAKAWNLLHRGGLPDHATQERFLWALCLLKSYDNEENNAARMGGVDEGTFRRWSWYFIEELSFCEANVVSQ